MLSFYPVGLFRPLAYANSILNLFWMGLEMVVLRKAKILKYTILKHTMGQSDLPSTNAVYFPIRTRVVFNKLLLRTIRALLGIKKF